MLSVLPPFSFSLSNIKPKSKLLYDSTELVELKNISKHNIRKNYDTDFFLPIQVLALVKSFCLLKIELKKKRTEKVE